MTTDFGYTRQVSSNENEPGHTNPAYQEDGSEGPASQVGDRITTLWIMESEELAVHLPLPRVSATPAEGMAWIEVPAKTRKHL